MKELVLFMAKVMPKEKIAELVKEECDKFIADPSDDNWNRLAATSMLMASKNLADDGDLAETMKDLDRLENYSKLHKGERKQ